jgi:DNA-directed RNA polymerase subunit RPC12/RpoP
MNMKCGNCGKVFSSESELACVVADIPNLFERIEPGGEVPNGECPDCGALVYPHANGEPKVLTCPSCGVEDSIAEIDLIPGYAKIHGISADGSFEWAGGTEVDWNNQRPANDPPEYICLHCNDRFRKEALIVD